VNWYFSVLVKIVFIFFVIREPRASRSYNQPENEDGNVNQNKKGNFLAIFSTCLLIWTQYWRSSWNKERIKAHIKWRATGNNLGQHIIDILAAYHIKVENCRAQCYDGASAMSSDVRGACAKIQEQQPKAQYTHCRNHIINLAIVHARVIRKMIDTL
jgi:hypothetical protein